MKEQIEEIYEVLVTDCGIPCPEELLKDLKA